MVPVHDYIALWEYIASLITSQSGAPSFSRVVLVDDEPHLQSQIAKIANKELFLVIVTPSADYQALDEDNYGLRAPGQACLFHLPGCPLSGSYLCAGRSVHLPCR